MDLKARRGFVPKSCFATRTVAPNGETKNNEPCRSGANGTRPKACAWKIDFKFSALANNNGLRPCQDVDQCPKYSNRHLTRPVADCRIKGSANDTNIEGYSSLT